MKDKKFILISSIIVFLVISFVVLVFNFFENVAVNNLKDSNKEPIYFGATYMTMNNPYFKIINDEIKTTVEANGDILITLDPALSIKKQKDQINYLLEKGVKVMFVNAIEADSLNDVLQKCHNNGVIIIVVDTNLNASEFVDYTVISDNYDAGVQAAKDMMQQKDEARIVLLEHSATMSGSQRIQGFVDTIQANDAYRIVARRECEGQLEIATPIMNRVIKEGITFDVVMALNDPAALGAMAAMQEANINDVSVYGVDGSPETKVLIKDGKMRGSVSQSPKAIGKKAIEMGYELLDKKTIEEDIYLIPVTLITQDKIQEYSLEGWQ